MCGRFTLTAKTSDIEKLLPHLKTIQTDLKPRYNISPSQNVAVITNTLPYELNYFRWGLIPFWAKDISIGSKMINARSETLLEKPSFKNLLRKKRCVIPATGFYEWKAIPGEKTKQPYYIKMKNDMPFFFAGLWDEWKDPSNGIIHSLTIITTSPNEIMKPLHNRMPVILPINFIPLWISEEQTGIKELQEELNPYFSDEMMAFKVSKMVNNPANEGIELIEMIQ